MNQGDQNPPTRELSPCVLDNFPWYLEETESEHSNSWAVTSRTVRFLMTDHSQPHFPGSGLWRRRLLCVLKTSEARLVQEAKTSTGSLFSTMPATKPPAAVSPAPEVFTIRSGSNSTAGA